MHQHGVAVADERGHRRQLRTVQVFPETWLVKTRSPDVGLGCIPPRQPLNVRPSQARAASSMFTWRRTSSSRCFPSTSAIESLRSGCNRPSDDRSTGRRHWFSDDAIDGRGRDAVDLDRLRSCSDLRRLLQTFAGILLDHFQDVSLRPSHAPSLLTARCRGRICP